MVDRRKLPALAIVVVLVLGCVPIVAGTVAGAATAESFATPFGIQYEAATGLVYAVDSYRNCIIRTGIDGSQWLTFGSRGMGRMQFLDPKGLYLDASGYLYVSDAGNSRIVKTKMDGSYWVTLGGLRGMGTGQFANPRGITVDESTGYVYVADSGNNRVVRTKMDGSGWQTWGTQGTGTNQFYLPTGVGYDAATGYVYVVDTANCRMVRGKMDGSEWTALGAFGPGRGQFRYPRGIHYEQDGTFVVADAGNCRMVRTDIAGSTWQEFGSPGFGVGQFSNPRGVTVSAAGDLYVADTLNHRIAKTGMDGSGWTTLSAVNQPNLGISYIEPPSGAQGDAITIHGVGFGPQQGSSVVDFNGKEAAVTSWSDTQIAVTIPDGATTGDVYVTVGGVQTNGMFFAVLGPESLFEAPFGVAFDPGSDTVYVSDTRHHRLVQINLDGENFAAYGTPGFGQGQFALPKGLYYGGPQDGYLYTVDSVNNRVVRTKMNGEGWLTLGTQGPGDGELYFPRNVFYDIASEYLYIADAGNNRIVKCKLDGSSWQSLGAYGSGTGQFFEPRGITYDPVTDFVYVADSMNCRIVKTKMDGGGWETFGSNGVGASQFRYPRSIYLDQPTGNLYVADTDNHRIVCTAFGGSGWLSLGSLGPDDGQFYYPRGIWFDAESGLVFVADSGNNRVVSTMMDGSNWRNIKGGPSIPFHWNLAEGTTRKGFTEYICLLNPGDSPAKVTITPHTQKGGAGSKSLTIAPHTRATLNAVDLVGSEQDVSVSIESSRPLIAERPVYFNRNGFSGGHDNVGRPDPSNEFYFAEGTTREGFQEWLTLQNPNSGAANAELLFMMANGNSKKVSVAIDARSRKTIKVSDVVGANQDVSVAIRSDVPIVAERPMYFRYRGAWSGGDISSGSVSPSNRHYFAEGSTRENFDEYICIMNPGERPAAVAVTYMLEDGTHSTQNVEVPALSRRTVDVSAFVGRGHDVSALVESQVPIVAERPMYFNYKGKWDGGHDCTGVEQPMTSFYFAEGSTRDGFDEYVTLMNPGDAPAKVTLTYMFPDGQGNTQTQQMDLGAHTRGTVDVASVVGRGKDVSVKIESSTPIVAERPLYFDYQGQISGGDCAVGYGI